MAEVERLIATYHNLFLICLVLAIVFLILSIALFFLFDIRNVIAVLSGQAEKKAIKKMQEETAYTGQLARRAPNKMARSMVSQSGSLNVPVPSGNHVIDPSMDHATIKTEALAEPEMYISKNDTMVLNNESMATSVLTADSTTVLSQDMLPQKPEKPKIDVSIVGFVLERQILMTHTDEKITD
ncbi:MAG: hypothetical protein IJ079_00710 [Lachnospiraceae bacterium]|nr:hypothetical protein [Lachnospiraceae bacterium]